MEIKHFRAFVAVAEHLHFTRAAEAINVSQPTLSMLIRQLEDGVGTSLLQRSTRQVVLTEMGQAMLPLARNAVAGLDSALDRMKDFSELRRGRVRIACFPSVAVNQLPEVVVEFRRTFPGVKVQLMDTVWQQVVDLVRDGRVDFGVGTYPPEMEGLRFDPVHRDEVMLMIPDGHRLAGRDHVSWAEIGEDEIIVPSDDTGVRTVLDDALAGTDIHLNTILEPALIMTIAALVSAGAGLGIILSSYLQAVEGFSGTTARLVEPEVVRDIGIIHRRDSIMTPAASAMHRMIVAHMQAE